MTTYLLAVGTVDAAAAGCDYLGGRVGPDDAVIVIGVVEGEAGTDARDVDDALNVAGVRLPGVETDRREGDPAGEILAAAAERGVDEIVLVSSTGSPAVGSTIPGVLEGADRPVRVVPRA